MNVDYVERHHIELDLGVIQSKVVVDGVDIARTVSKIKVEANVGDIPTVTLSMPNPKIAAETSGVVRVDEATREALVLLGWTPPPVPLPPISQRAWDGGDYFTRRSAELLLGMGWTPPAEPVAK